MSSTANITPKEDEYQMMERLDEEQIAASLQGKVIDTYFYHFVVGGKEVVGISWAGTKFLSRKLADAGAPISIEEVKMEKTDEGWTAYACAMDVHTKEKRWALSEQPFEMTLRDNTKKADPFCKQKALNKAQRNALRTFMPEPAIIEALKEWQRARAGGGGTPTTATEPKVMKDARPADRTIPARKSPEEAASQTAAPKQPKAKTSRIDPCACGHNTKAHFLDDAPGKYYCAQCNREGKNKDADDCDLAVEMLK